MVTQMRLYNDDMFNILWRIEDQSINLLLTDFPYGTLNKKRNEWDKVIDYDRFWQQVDRICKPNAAIISTAAQPFTSVLTSTNYKDFKYCLVWEKSKATGYLNAKKQPMRAHEDIVVFYKKQPTYNPQMTVGKPYDKGTAVRDAIQYAKSIHRSFRDFGQVMNRQLRVQELIKFSVLVVLKQLGHLQMELNQSQK